MFFGGSWWDGIVSFVLGGFVSGLGYLLNNTVWAAGSSSGTRRAHAYEFLSALIIAVVARACGHARLRYGGRGAPPACSVSIKLSSLQWLLQARPPHAL